MTSALAALAAVALLVVAPGPAGAHRVSKTSGASSGVKGVSEKRLRAWETKVIGSEHAAQHARERAAKRKLTKALKNRRFRSWYQRKVRLQRTRARKADGPASSIGTWNGEFSLPVFAISSAVLPTGKVLFFAYPNHPDAPARAKNESWAYLWDPALGTGDSAFKAVLPPIDDSPGGTGKPVNLWCSGISLLADGRVLVTGGNLKYATATTDFAGLNHVYTFNPFNETWTRQPNMAHGRWYPTQMLMPDGRTVIIQGNDETGNNKNLDIEVFTPSPNLDGVGTITKTGSLFGPFTGSYYDFYPHMFWMPSGRGLVAGPTSFDSFYIGVNGSTLTDAPAMSTTRTWGTAVLEPQGPSGSSKILAIGGADITLESDGDASATETSESFDESSPASWKPEPSLNLARAHHNTVLLPDQSMVTVGGGVGTKPYPQHKNWTFTEAHKQVELRDPVTGQWTPGPSQNEGRAYHSTAVLLPDGRVMSAGDDNPYRTRQYDTAEIYEPPYLHKGARPTIGQAPTTVGWNTDFTITASSDVTKAVLIAPSAVTHSVDMNQRLIPLTPTTTTANTKTFRSPPNANVALPGHYMLFALNDNGVPSVAKWIQLRTPDPVPNPPVTPPAGTPPASTPPAITPPAITPPASGVISSQQKSTKPTVSATIVRRNGKRVVRVKLGKSSALRAKVKVSLRNRRGRTVASRTRALRTGRTTIVKSPKVTATVRSARATFVALVR